MLFIFILGDDMNAAFANTSPIRVDQNRSQTRFHISFQNSVITICPHQMLEMISNINRREKDILRLGLLLSADHKFSLPLENKPEYKLCFGRTILVLSQQEMIEFIAQMWEKNPLLMHWVCSDEMDFS